MGRRKSAEELAIAYRKDHQAFQAEEAKRYYFTVWAGYALSLIVWVGTIGVVFYGEAHRWPVGVVVAVVAIPVAGNLAAAVGKLQRKP